MSVVSVSVALGVGVGVLTHHAPETVVNVISTSFFSGSWEDAEAGHASVVAAAKAVIGASETTGRDLLARIEEAVR